MGNGFVDRTDDILTNYDYFVYHTQPEIDNWADKMADTYEQILEKVVYGKSHENRDLYALVIKDKQGRDNVPKVPLRVILSWLKHHTYNIPNFCYYVNLDVLCLIITS